MKWSVAELLLLYAGGKGATNDTSGASPAAAAAAATCESVLPPSVPVSGESTWLLPSPPSCTPVTATGASTEKLLVAGLVLTIPPLSLTATISMYCPGEIPGAFNGLVHGAQAPGDNIGGSGESASATWQRNPEIPEPDWPSGPVKVASKVAEGNALGSWKEELVRVELEVLRGVESGMTKRDKICAVGGMVDERGGEVGEEEEEEEEAEEEKEAKEGEEVRGEEDGMESAGGRKEEAVSRQVNVTILGEKKEKTAWGRVRMRGGRERRSTCGRVVSMLKAALADALLRPCRFHADVARTLKSNAVTGAVTTASAAVVTAVAAVTAATTVAANAVQPYLEGAAAAAPVKEGRQGSGTTPRLQPATPLCRPSCLL
ncbi:unnamed protein product [Closterium sp. NIES-53]